MSYFMKDGTIDEYAVYVLLIIYLLHVVIMKMNHNYEVALKKAVASFLEVRELNRMAHENINHFHYNLDSRFPCIESLNLIKFKQEGDILIFENQNVQVARQMQGQFLGKANNEIRYRMKPIQRIKIRDERFVTPDDRQLMAKARLKQAVIKILTKIQAFHIYEKIKRNKHCIIHVNAFIKNFHQVPQNRTEYTQANKLRQIGGDMFATKSNPNILINTNNQDEVLSSENSDHIFDDHAQSDSDDFQEDNMDYSIVKESLEQKSSNSLPKKSIDNSLGKDLAQRSQRKKSQFLREEMGSDQAIKIHGNPGHFSKSEVSEDGDVKQEGETSDMWDNETQQKINW
mmetsp:Transcript_10168/g.17138  ORF Transcript_10168/g.17138 Transcript_10168/m.17138 type:complete len:343 (-) Transcript_10168:801-1829(-)